MAPGKHERIPARRLGAQAKLAIGRADDPLEHEADQFADRIVRGTESASVVRRACTCGESPETTDCAQCEARRLRLRREPEIGLHSIPAARTDAAPAGAIDPLGAAEAKIDAVAGGRALADRDRAFFESQLGVDLGAVQIHDDASADAAARSVSALAFTKGASIVFRRGHYAPNTADGRRLLAHELVHVVQQGAAMSRPVDVLSSTAGQVQRETDDDDPYPEIHAPRVVLPKEGPAQKGIEGEDEPIKEEGGGPAVDELAVDGEKRSAGKDSAYADASVQLQAAPPPPAAAPPPSVAAVTYLPTLMDQTPTGWGVTVQDDIIVDITAYSAGPAWRCVVSRATQQSRQGVRLLPGVSECTAAAVSGASCATLKTMKTSLNDVADQKSHSGWYMKAAVQAHENLHNTQYRGGLNPAFTTYKTAVEALSVPAAAAANAGAAKAAIKALPAYTTARAALHAADVAAANATASHSPMAPFNAAEHGVVDPMIATIDARRTAKSCSP